MGVVLNWVGVVLTSSFIGKEFIGMIYWKSGTTMLLIGTFEFPLVSPCLQVLIELRIFQSFLLLNNFPVIRDQPIPLHYCSYFASPVLRLL